MRLYPVDVGGITLQPKELDDLCQRIKKAFCTVLPPEKISYGVIQHILGEVEEELINSPLGFFWDGDV